MATVYDFECPANDNDAFKTVCEDFMAAIKPGSGISRAKRDDLFNQMMALTRETTAAALECVHDFNVILRRSQIVRVNAGPDSKLKVSL